MPARCRAPQIFRAVEAASPITFASPTTFATARKVQCVASGGGGPCVRRITSAALSAGVFGMPGGRVFSCKRPATPSAMNRSCQRQTQVFDLPVATMIALVPIPSADKMMIRARQTCFCGEDGAEMIAPSNRGIKHLDQLQAGDTLVVVRIDRLARSLSHLLEIIERLESKGAHFRSLQDPIDTASPQGKFTLQALGAAAEFERAQIRERTKAGLRSAKAEGRVGGNPG